MSKRKTVRPGVCEISPMVKSTVQKMGIGDQRENYIVL